MIGTIDITCNASNPNIALKTVYSFISSPSNIRVLNVPKKIGDWKITKVYITTQYPDNSIQSIETKLVGGVYVGTIQGSSVSGKTENGFTITASGTDENGNAVSGYTLGKGDVVVLNQDSTITVGGVTYYLHLLDSIPSTPHKGDTVIEDGKLKIYSGTEWIQISGGGDSWWIVSESGKLVPKADISSVYISADTELEKIKAKDITLGDSRIYFDNTDEERLLEISSNNMLLSAVETMHIVGDWNVQIDGGPCGITLDTEDCIHLRGIGVNAHAKDSEGNDIASIQLNEEQAYMCGPTASIGDNSGCSEVYLSENGVQIHSEAMCGVVLDGSDSMIGLADGSVSIAAGQYDDIAENEIVVQKTEESESGCIITEGGIFVNVHGACGLQIDSSAEIAINNGCTNNITIDSTGIQFEANCAIISMNQDNESINVNGQNLGFYGTDGIDFRGNAYLRFNDNDVVTIDKLQLVQGNPNSQVSSLFTTSNSVLSGSVVQIATAPDAHIEVADTALQVVDISSNVIWDSRYSLITPSLDSVVSSYILNDKAINVMSISADSNITLPASNASAVVDFVLDATNTDVSSHVININGWESVINIAVSEDDDLSEMTTMLSSEHALFSFTQIGNSGNMPTFLLTKKNVKIAESQI